MHYQTKTNLVMKKDFAVSLKKGDVYYSLVLGPSQTEVGRVVYTAVYGEDPEADRIAIAEGNVFATSDDALSAYAKIHALLQESAASEVVVDSAWDDDPIGFFEACQEKAQELVPATLTYEWFDDDSTKCIRIWVPEVKEVYTLNWLDTVGSVEEFGDRIQEDVVRLESYGPIGRTGSESIVYQDVYDQLESVLEVEARQVYFDDNNIWYYTKDAAGHKVEFGAFGNDLDGENYDLALSMEKECSERALLAFAGVAGVFVRAYASAGDTADEVYLASPTLEELHTLLECVKGSREEAVDFVDLVSNSGLDRAEITYDMQL